MGSKKDKSRGAAQHRGKTGKSGLAASAVLAAMAGGGEAAQPLGHRFDWTGEQWLRERQARRTAAHAQSGLLRVAHGRISAALETALDEELLDHLRARAGSLPAAHLPYSPFSRQELERLADFHVEARVCGGWLVSYIRPDGDMAGWVTADEVRVHGKLDRITRIGVEKWGSDDLNTPALRRCRLPEGAPAIVSRYRAPAAERRTSLGSEWRVRDCPAGEVGSGIRERREMRTVSDGFGTQVAPDSGAGAWIETGRNCRPPKTGTVVMPVECRIGSGPFAGTVSMRMMSYPWTEQRQPDDARRTAFVVDWGGPTVLKDFCDGGPGEQVDVNRLRRVESRSRSCASVHGGGWDLGGVREDRSIWTTAVTFPDSWNRPAARMTSIDPWAIAADDCRRERRRSEDRAQTLSCPQGQVGTVVETRRRSWLQVEYAGPVPHRGAHEKPGSETDRVVSTANHCGLPRTNDNGGGGGNDGGNGDERGYRDRVTGLVYHQVPIGADRRDFSSSESTGNPRNPVFYNRDRRNHGGDDRDSVSDDSSSNRGGGGWM